MRRLAVHLSASGNVAAVHVLLEVAAGRPQSLRFLAIRTVARRPASVPALRARRWRLWGCAVRRRHGSRRRGSCGCGGAGRRGRRRRRRRRDHGRVMVVMMGQSERALRAGQDRFVRVLQKVLVGEQVVGGRRVGRGQRVAQRRVVRLRRVVSHLRVHACVETKTQKQKSTKIIKTPR